MATKLTRPTHIIAIQSHLVADSSLQAASPGTFGYILVHTQEQKAGVLTFFMVVFLLNETYGGMSKGSRR
jgi:hypothetical protein